MRTSVIGFPRIGSLRELKFASESYFKGEKDPEELLSAGKALREKHWRLQKASGLDSIPSNDFSFYDGMLDTAVLLNAVPKRYRELGLGGLDEYFAMARGYQGSNGDVRALAMKKWFNTNYHYLVPEIEDDTAISLAGTKVFEEFSEAMALGILTKPVVIGPFTFLKLAKFTGRKRAADFTGGIVRAYSSLIEKLAASGAEWIQFDEPSLAMDQTSEDVSLFSGLYAGILEAKGKAKILLQTYFGDIRDCYGEAAALDFDGIGLDFIEGKESLRLIRENGFPDHKTLFAGLVNGKNIWRNNYAKTLSAIGELKGHADHIVLGTSCSLLHVPFTVENETQLDNTYKRHLAFAVEKLRELADLKKLASCDLPLETDEYAVNEALFKKVRQGADKTVRARINSLSERDFTRLPVFAEREKIQNEFFHLPLLPTTTIGSFPQTADVRANRSAFKKGRISEKQYMDFNKQKIKDCIELQEKIGLDVLVHGEFERNDMVEYFGDHLNGFLFTEKAWVQSYGTRCVKPPIVWGDVSRRHPITVEYSKYAQSLTDQYVKGMLTGPVTILNWSFPREDISLKECAFQIALAIRDEVLDLEANGIKMIQIDEAALREKLPLRKADWHSGYLDWAIPAFRLVHSGVKPETQIHTHMCYSEFGDIIKDIDNMDADVITFEASRSDLAIIDALNECGFKTEVGPGVYDIHSPRVPAVSEIRNTLHKMLGKIPKEKLWVNPDCGLKTRGYRETVSSLEHLVQAAKEARGEL
ncbi:5-methyltetrahydropteroyltriglutamate--homocysteine S-methyltransferase [Caproiciproducens sp. NJN-50]|uniref:5-methyltetrahydropteroyltriglutamate-- homocysteine S-methyltransferase n=1 Tax=Caproiciproducens sp. NJN-50 TaxID=2507162 RepID=UPI000FFE183E|nr:5-methyltetrahydropteroyltriglutamate--homocysteine S-methyltransferase [Caproiciproducens sp. NJN-50]QAT50406.1 5-methyltetrahydropteroyltriglutamate--homocysteine S-methyltransferase [Caproiciproducens sp. NJN-50]